MFFLVLSPTSLVVQVLTAPPFLHMSSEKRDPRGCHVTWGWKPPPPPRLLCTWQTKSDCAAASQTRAPPSRPPSTARGRANRGQWQRPPPHTAGSPGGATPLTPGVLGTPVQRRGCPSTSQLPQQPCKRLLARPPRPSATWTSRGRTRTGQRPGGQGGAGGEQQDSIPALRWDLTPPTSLPQAKMEAWGIHIPCDCVLTGSHICERHHQESLEPERPLPQQPPHLCLPRII